MVEKWFRSKPKSASAERCLRFLGAMKPIATSEMALSNRSIVCVTGVLSHCGLRKANCKMGVVTGIRSLPGIAVAALTWAAVHWTQGTIRVDNSKGAVDRIVYFSPDVETALQQWHHGQPPGAAAVFPSR